MRSCRSTLIECMVISNLWVRNVFPDRYSFLCIYKVSYQRVAGQFHQRECSEALIMSMMSTHKSYIQSQLTLHILCNHVNNPVQSTYFECVPVDDNVQYHISRAQDIGISQY
eukprot:354786_1